MPGGAAAVAGVSSVVGATVGTWQRFEAVVTELQAACSPAALQTFFHGWDQHGGGLCTGMRQHVCALLQADLVAWREVHFAAEALQELCWEQLHTGHWMDVAVEWRDAYCLYTVLTVVAMMAHQHQRPTPHASPQQHHQQQQDPQHAADPTTAAAEQPGPAAAAAEAPNTAGQEQTSKAAAAGAGAGADDAQAKQQQQQLLREGLRQLDMAALMGGLRFRPWVDKLIDVLDSQLQELGAVSTASTASAPTTQVVLGSGGEIGGPVAPAAPFGSKRKAGDSEGVLGGGGFGGQASQPAGSGADAAGGSVAALDAEPRHKQHKPTPHPQQQQEQEQEQQQQQPSGRGPAPQAALPPGSLSSGSAVVPLHQAPSMEHFLVNCLLAEGGPQPAVLRGVMDSWPAMTRWQDMDYLRRVAGRRTVPVEVGSHYLEEGWGTRLMTLRDFIAAMGTAKGPNAGSTGHAAAAAAEAAPDQQQQQEGQPAPLLYLAQHQLFEQVPALASDILTPDYCMLGSKGVSSVNAWFGPAGTVTPLHQDPEHNLLAQVVGRKYVRLYDPAHTPRLYPHASGMHTNTSRVDLHRVDEQQYPGFSMVPYVDVVLEPGDMLYMPPKWWHFVQSLSLSFSVSFWWS